MREIIQNFNRQFAFRPVIGNVGRLVKNPIKIVVAGMGGSHLAADLLKDVYPEFVTVHSDYGLPRLPPSTAEQKTLFIFSSFSGNTEETLDGFALAQKQKLPTAVVTGGGHLLALAIKGGVPYIQLPTENLQPRTAIGYSFIALSTLAGKNGDARDYRRLVNSLKPASLENAGKIMAKKLRRSIPIIYASEKNRGLALNWKVRFNETAKSPAFYNTFPELNHNEMNAPSKIFHYLFLQDAQDHPQIQKRMKILSRLYRENKLNLDTLPLKGKSRWEKIFRSIVLADWTAYYLALAKNEDPSATPLVEEFKKYVSLI